MRISTNNDTSDNGIAITSGGNVGVGISDPGSLFEVAGAIATSVTVISNTNQTLGKVHSNVLVDASGGAITVELPDATGKTGRWYSIKKIDSSANVVTLDAHSTHTIDGALTFSLPTQYGSVLIVTDGADWYIMAAYLH